MKWLTLCVAVAFISMRNISGLDSEECTVIDRPLNARFTSFDGKTFWIQWSVTDHNRACKVGYNVIIHSDLDKSSYCNKPYCFKHQVSQGHVSSNNVGYSYPICERYIIHIRSERKYSVATIPAPALIWDINNYLGSSWVVQDLRLVEARSDWLLLSWVGPEFGSQCVDHYRLDICNKTSCWTLSTVTATTRFILSELKYRIYYNVTIAIVDLYKKAAQNSKSIQFVILHNHNVCVGWFCEQHLYSGNRGK